MDKWLKNITCLSLPVLLLFFCLNVYAVSFKKTIRNESSIPWTIKVSVSYGNVYLTGCPINGPCTIAPHSSISAVYTTTDAYTSGTINFYCNTKQKYWGYGKYNNSYHSVFAFRDFQGDSKQVSFNNPNKGDVLIKSMLVPVC